MYARKGEGEKEIESASESASDRPDQNVEVVTVRRRVERVRRRLLFRSRVLVLGFIVETSRRCGVFGLLGCQERTLSLRV